MKSNTITIRPLRQSDTSQLIKLANNQKIVDHLLDYFPSPYRKIDALSFIEKSIPLDPLDTFAITNDNQFVGIISLNKKEDIYRYTAELGYWVGQPYWGNGFATKAIDEITLFGFEEMGLHRIYAHVFDFNTVSMRVLEKNKYQKEAILQNGAIKKGAVVDIHLYARLRPSD
ncbi:MAG: ribosomal-protein-alanine N-acetyltransferase [Paraglaciecola sp.]|jgi:ribosomal-protein-alanine N-acetyltransferase